jgi:hypothetical protein
VIKHMDEVNVFGLRYYGLTDVMFFIDVHLV